MNKQTLIIFLIAVVLVGLLLYFENLFQEKPEEPREENTVELFTPLAEADCSKIEISGFATSATLVRKGDQWFTRGGHKADPTAVSSLFNALEDVGTPELKSIKSDHGTYMKFQVDNFLGARLKMYDRQDTLKVDIIVGKVDRDFFHTPVRRPGSSNVYSIRGMLYRIVRQPDWRNFNIFRYDLPQIRRVCVRAGDERFAVARDSEAAPWYFTEPTSASVDMQTMQSWLQQISYLRASDFVEATTSTEMLTSYGLTASTAQLSVGLDDGSSHTVVFGNFDETRRRYYAKRLDDPQVYWVSQSTHNLLMRKGDELKAKPPPKPPALPPPVPRPTTATAPAAIPRVQPPATTGTGAVTTPTTKAAAAPSSQPVAPKAPPAKPPPPTVGDQPTTPVAPK